MTVFGLLLCVAAVSLLYRRYSLLWFGKRTEGIIIGYGSRTDGRRGIQTYPYKIQYTVGAKTYIAQALESVTVSHGTVPNKNLHKTVTVCFRENQPNTVTVKEFHDISVIGILLFLLGIFAVLIRF